jgi:hypothetical protein
VTSLSGINDDLTPLLRMAAPADWDALAAERIRQGKRLFRSWLLAFAVLPVDYDDLTIGQLEPGQRFLELSSIFQRVALGARVPCRTPLDGHRSAWF